MQAVPGMDTLGLWCLDGPIKGTGLFHLGLALKYLLTFAAVSACPDGVFLCCHSFQCSRIREEMKQELGEQEVTACQNVSLNSFGVMERTGELQESIIQGIINWAF